MTINNHLNVSSLPELLPNGMMPSDVFPIALDEIRIGGNSEANPVLDAVYNRHGELEFFYESDGGLALSLKALDSEIVALNSNQNEEIGLLGISTRVTGDNTFSLKMIPKKSPFLILNDDNATKVTAYMINGPDLHPGGGVSTYEYNEFVINIITLEAAKDCRKNIKEHKYDYVVTHEVQLKHSKGGTLSSDSVFSCLNRFRRFLNFVRGGYCGIGHIRGFNHDDQLCYAYLGFNKADPFKVTVGWFNIGLTRLLSDVFSNYCSGVDNKNNTYVILRSIEFYRASNIISESAKDVALVSSFAALETLVPHILQQKAGWSVDLIKSKLKFADLLRAATAFIRVQVDLFEHSPELQKKMKGFSDIDEYGLLAIFRNRIVHQGKPFKYTGIELHEIWEFSQWLVEIFIFYLIGYDGEMNDRRKYTGWSGGSVPVPIKLG